MKRLTNLFFFALCASAVAIPSQAQEGWTMQRCMQYAVEHNHAVRQAVLELDNYRAARTGAAGRFLPDVDASIGAQYNFGRAIDPETNGYTDVSTFYNGYSVSTSLPLFDGFSRLHALRAAQAGMLMGREALRQQQDLAALNVLQAFVGAAYYEGMVRMAEEKVEETRLLLRQTRLLEEVGRKSAADVAQVESQQAEADYELIHQQNLQASALLELKKEMGFPLNDTITIQKPVAAIVSRSTPIVPCRTDIASLEVARHQTEVAKHEWYQARASLFPILSVSAGLSTTYYHTLHTASASSFNQQIRNNMGEYVGLSLSIPLFSRLQSITGIRRAKNNYRIACEAYEQRRLELEKLAREAWQDWQGYLKQTAQMEKKVAADSLACGLTRRQFEEGISTAIDLHATSVQLQQSRSALLQCRLMAIVKEQYVRYYNGEQIWTE